MAGRESRRVRLSRFKWRLPVAAHDSFMTTSLSSANAHHAGSSRIAKAPTSEGERCPLPTSELERMAESMLRAARAGGATAAETEVSQAVGQSVTVRNGEVETIAYNRDKGIGVTVFIGQRRGHASTADFAPDAIDATVAKALAIARYTARDAAAGLADPDRLARSVPDLDLYHPWDLSVDDAITMGREAESVALPVGVRVVRAVWASVARCVSGFRSR